MAKQYFHLTIGPVQAFVAQARRTRDFWAGSFLLSFLSSVAMTAVRQQKGQIEFPIPDENYLDRLENKDSKTQTPLQGSIPNRFKALGAEVDEDFNPELVVEAIKGAWIKLAQKVWDKDLADVASSLQRDIWERQIDNFWDISWCLTDNSEVANLLDRRKNWRTHLTADEPGVKCSIMEGYQELSGASKTSNAVFQEFWSSVRGQTKQISRDLREDEYLCSIAFVKRRFVHIFEDFSYELPAKNAVQAKQIFGWKIPTSVPSVAYLAATPWLAASISKTKENSVVTEKIKILQEKLDKVDVAWEGGETLKIIAETADKVGFSGFKWTHVSGQVLFRPALEQEIKEAAKFDIQLSENLKQVNKALRDLRVSADLSEPSPFYAVLLMDGDSLGTQMSDIAKQKGISNALQDFMDSVPEIVAKHSGFLIYAGGDDVLALVPQPYALNCAYAVHQSYDKAFAKVNEALENKITTSISAAIEFAHYKTPLTSILQDSHSLLDKIAKEKAGRNSLAIRLWRQGGVNAEWFGSWDKTQSLLSASKDVAANLQGELSRSFFFKLESIISKLGLSDEGHGFKASQIESLVKAAWQHTGKKVDSLPKDMALNLLKASQLSIYNENKELVELEQFMPGALRIIQFLASENIAFLKAIESLEG